MRTLVGHPLDVMAGNPATTEWTDLGRALAAEFGLDLAAPHAPPVGEDEMGHYLGRHGEPVLSSLGGPSIPGAVLLPLVDPVPLTVVSVVHVKGLSHPGLAVLMTALAEVGRTERWMRRPAGSWLPEPDGLLLRA